MSGWARIRLGLSQKRADRRAQAVANMARLDDDRHPPLEPVDAKLKFFSRSWIRHGNRSLSRPTAEIMESSAGGVAGARRAWLQRGAGVWIHGEFMKNQHQALVLPRLNAIK